MIKALAERQADDEGTGAIRISRTDFGTRRTLRRARSSILARGEPILWITGGSLVICVLMIVGLLALVAYQGGLTFWPRPLTRFTLADGGSLLGEVTRSEHYRLSESAISTLSGESARRAAELLHADRPEVRRRLLRTGNFDLTNTHFHWVSDFDVADEDYPEWAVILERRAWGRFYGYPKRFSLDGETVAEGPEATWEAFKKYHEGVTEVWQQRYQLQKFDFGEVHARLEDARLRCRGVELEFGKDSDEYVAAEAAFRSEVAGIEEEKQRLAKEIRELDEKNARYRMVLETEGGQEATIGLADIVRGYPANRQAGSDRLSTYLSRWWEFLSDDPREANSEGGIWPALIGTVIMTLLMSAAVVPFGVLAALYLREYARAGVLVSTVRIAVNNLAGVPSIVFGVFGLGFFCYIVGGSLDQVLFSAKLPNPTFGKGGVLWASLTLALLTLPVVIVATEEAIAAVPGSLREGSYACGASKWQTIRRIVLPRALPGIMTGFVLAMARGAGEVAPLMLVGAVKLAPDLPIDSVFPYLHPERSFMHLGFHIYDVGFQSQNSEAAKPMVFTTTLLLIAIVALLNLAAIWVRNRLRRRFVTSQV